MWARTRETAIFKFLRKSCERPKSSGKFEPGVILGAEYFFGGILGGHVTGVGKIQKKTNARFPVDWQIQVAIRKSTTFAM